MSCVLAKAAGSPADFRMPMPKGEDEIRFQISADHTPADIDEALDALRGFRR
jgi:7-keto-8-aminopelargonate synthetase-like enzyme